MNGSTIHRATPAYRGRLFWRSAAWSGEARTISARFGRDATDAAHSGWSRCDGRAGFVDDAR